MPRNSLLTLFFYFYLALQFLLQHGDVLEHFHQLWVTISKFLQLILH